jgi:hypothetical protein
MTGPRIDLFAIVLGLFMAGWACRNPKPVEPPEVKPRIVVRTTIPCLAPPPELPTLAGLPTVKKDAVEVSVPIATYNALLLTITLLTNHVIGESIRCGIAWPELPPDAGPTP